MGLELVGKTGRVTAHIRGTSGLGEVMLDIRGGSERFFAYAEGKDADYPVGTNVMVVDYLAGRTVTVAKI